MCVLSPLLFTVVLDEGIKKNERKTTNMHIGNLGDDSSFTAKITFTDDIVLIEDS